MALPGGVMRVYARDLRGVPKFIGENTLDHTPQGSNLAIRIGEAFDVTVQPTLVKQDRIGERRMRYSMEYLVHNGRDQAVAVEICHGGVWRYRKVVEENLKSTQLDARTLQWTVPVPAGDDVKLSFTLETGW